MHKNNLMGDTTLYYAIQSKKPCHLMMTDSNAWWWPAAMKTEQQRFITSDMAKMFESLTQNRKFLGEFVSTSCAGFVYRCAVNVHRIAVELFDFFHCNNANWKREFEKKSSSWAHSMRTFLGNNKTCSRIQLAKPSNQQNGRPNASIYGQWVLFMGILLVADRLIIYFIV